MGVQCCLKVVSSGAAGAHVDIISSIIDHDLTPFTPKLAIVFGVGAVNTFLTPMLTAYGVDDGTHHRSYSGADNSQFGLKLAGVGISGQYSVLRYIATAAFGGVILRKAYFSAFASGSATLTYDQNDVTGDSFAVMFVGGDIDALASFQGLNPQTGLGVEPVSLGMQLGAGSSGGTGTGLSATTSGWGLAAAGAPPGDVQQNATAESVQYFAIGGGNSRTISADHLIAAAQTLTSFDADGFTTSTNTGQTYWAVGGCLAVAGVMSQPPTASIVRTVAGIDIRGMMFLSTGQLAAAGAQTDYSQWMMGAADGTHQACSLTGESATGPSLLGMYTLRDDRIVLLTDSFNGASTALVTEAVLGGFDNTDGSFLVNWLTSDGAARQVFWLAWGDTLPPPPPPPPPATCEPTVLRRLRRSPHVNLERLRLFCSRFEVDLQRGRGIVGDPSVAPTITLRVSTDGGQTWSSDIQMTTGAAGDFRARSYAMQLGSSDDFVYEVSVSDEVVPWALAAAYADLIKGSS